MKVLFIAKKENPDSGERELYEMDPMDDVLGFDRLLLDPGLLTMLPATPDSIEASLQDEHLGPINPDEACGLVALEWTASHGIHRS